MRNDERFEIERSFDLLPHVVGSSWAVIWFRLNKIKNPSREDYRDKVLEYFKILEPLFNSFPEENNFLAIKEYVELRKNLEFKKILDGLNPEVEKRYERYIDYG